MFCAVIDRLFGGLTCCVAVTQLMIDYDEFAPHTDFNQSLQTAAEADQPDWRSKSEGSACSSNEFCTSGVCVVDPSATTADLPDAPGPQRVCVLDDYKEYSRSRFFGESPNTLDYLHGVASSAFYRPVWASLLVAAAGLVPMDWNGRQLNSPAIQSSIGAVSVIFGARSWVAWSSFPGGWLDGHVSTNSLRSVYMTLVDCGGLSLEETAGLKSVASGYYCYSARKEPTTAAPTTTSATFEVVSGECQTSSGGRCVNSQNYPSDYNERDACTITITGTASLSATSFETESCCDYLTISPNAHQYGGDYGPSGVHVSSGTTVEWHADSSATRSGWELCLSACDATCQSQPPGGGNAPPSNPSDSMASTIDGIVASPSDDYVTNPVLASFVTMATVWQIGLFFSMVASLLSTIFAFPISCAKFCSGIDLVCCFGRCCPMQMDRTGGEDAMVTTEENDVAPDGAIAPLSPAEPMQPDGHTSVSTVAELLSNANLSKYHAKLTELGVQSVDDFKDLDESDYETEVGMKKMEVKRLLRSLSSCGGASNNGAHE